ncbi:uncharacterized protein LOC123015611 isoform X2 [Tribolium madens]|uniref:uncharacterized protein LOC123015611 isoform X2 n=1 Tax=Tribolium madens TaxID=41895 RepID=UPI001CF759CA|nr:uncharacterized protein LOC123015611 isoform X2 [Tribolium madens]
MGRTLGVPQKSDSSRRRKFGRQRPAQSPSLDQTIPDGHVHAEWDVGHGGTMEVEVREEASPGTKSGDSTALLVNNTPAYPMADGPVVIVRVEEVLLVVLVLMIWVAAIALFFNRWGKIRMLEPYQPKFHQQPHRPSCPLAPLSPPAPQVSNSLPRAQKPTTQRMSFSKYNVNAMTDPLSALPSPIIRRPRQNSVFVGSSTMAILNPPPRRVKSAIDIQHMVVNEHSPTSLTGSVIPILNRDRRPSITIERPRHRPSIAIVDRPPPPPRYRRSSCFVERPSRPHRNFISFEHPIIERKMSINMPSCSYHQPPPIVSFEAHVEPAKVDLPKKLPKLSRSFEQPPKERTRPAERMANSLDVSSVSFDRRSSIVEEDRSSPVFICLDETRITAPLLEGLKSSDV